MVKFKKIPSFSAISAALMSFAALAEPTVAIDGVRQRYPWNGLVDIDYTVSGMRDAGYDAVDFKVAFTFTSAAKSILKICTSLAPATPPAADGTYRVTWDAKDDGIAALVADGKLKATLEKLGDPTPAEAEFMIIDISGGCTGETKCPVTYVRASTDPAESEKYNTDEYKVGKIVLRKVHAKGQTFRMGVGTDYGDVSNDNPAAGNWHEVGFTKDYFLGIFEFTFGQFKTVVGDGTEMGNKAGENQYTYGGGMPKEDFNMAPAYKLTHNDYFESIEVVKDTGAIVWRGTVYGGGIMGLLNSHLAGTATSLLSLPTEAQWEYVARCGSRLHFPLGNRYDYVNKKSTFDETLYPYAWNNSNSSSLNYQDKTATHMHVVGTKEHDPWGFYDMLGNAAEQVEDWYDSAGYASGIGYVEGGVTWDPTGPAGGTVRVARGGDYMTQDLSTLPSSRGDNNVNAGPTSDGGHRVGVRLKADVLDVEPIPGEVLASDETDLALDASASAFNVIAPADVADIRPILWNSAADWAEGGDPGTTATLTVRKLDGDAAADPATWVEKTSDVVISAAGAGAYAWAPAVQALYGFTLTAGERTLTAYYNLNDTTGLQSMTPIGSCEITLPTPCPWMDKPAEPALVVKDGDKVLTKGVDYLVTCDDIAVGPATATVEGIGFYTGVTTFDFEIVENENGPKVAVTNVRQRYPWDGKVDIDYAVTGMDGFDPYAFRLSFVFTSASADCSVACKTMDVSAVPTQDGEHRIVWDAVADGLGGVSAPDGVITATLAKAAPTPDEAEFMIVDVSGGCTGDKMCPVTYVRASRAAAESEKYNTDEYKIGKLVFRKVHAKGQTFRMGVGTDYGDVSNNDPAAGNWHEVGFTKDYFLGLFEFTYGQFKTVVGDGMKMGNQVNETQYTYGGAMTAERSDCCPAYKLTDAQWFTSIEVSEDSPGKAIYHGTVFAGGVMGMINAHIADGTAIKWPTEAQWEFAARCGSRLHFPLGNRYDYVNKKNAFDTTLYPYAWNGSNSTALNYLNKESTCMHPVGSKAVDPWGFYDMLGNASEQVSDWYDSTGYASGVGYVADGITWDPTGPADDAGFAKRGARGGNYQTQDLYTTPSVRGDGGNQSRQNSVRLMAVVNEAVDVDPGQTIASAQAAAPFVFDASEYKVYAPAHVSAVLPIAWNSAADWAKGGSGLNADIALAEMDGDRTADPATWTEVSSVALSGASGEGTVNWRPSEQKLYRLTMTVGETVSVAYFDLTETEGMVTAKPMGDCELTVVVGEVGWTGYTVRPQIKFTDGNKVLVEGVDYVVASSAKDLGDAVISVTGLGDYKDTIEVPFKIVPPVRTLVAEGESATVTWNISEGVVKVRTTGEAVPVVWNDTETFPAVSNIWWDAEGNFTTNVVTVGEWTAGGKPGDGVTARVSAAPLASATAAPGEYVTIVESEGEGVFAWKPEPFGYWSLKFEICRDGVPTGKALVRTVKVDAGGFLINVR